MNIRSIARESGVSTATVSRVLNNSSLVNPETRQKVMEVVEALDFKLRNTARKNFTIGVTVPAISQTQLNHNFVCEFLAGIAQSVSKLQAAIKVIDINDLLLIPDKRGSCNDFCKEMGINAFIHMLAPIQLHSCFDRIADDGIPQVAFEHQFERSDIYWIDVNNQNTSYDLARNLIQLGARDFAIVTAERKFKGQCDRYAGFVAAVKESGLDIPSYWDIERRDTTVSAGATATLSLLACAAKPPRVIYFTNAELALGGIKMLINRGLSLPKDVIVAFFDDSSFANWFPVPVVYLKQPAYEIGLKAGNFFLTHNSYKRSTQELLTPELFIGQEVVEALEQDKKK